MATEGQVWTFGFSGTTNIWTAPDKGIYKIQCYGAQGGGGGTKGSLVESISPLLQDAQLSLRAGMCPKGSYANGFGEGSTSGEDSNTTYGEYYESFATYAMTKLTRKNSSYGVGDFYRYRGYPDAAFGGINYTICDSNGSHSGGCAGHGGGGSSSVYCNGTIVMQASGGAGSTTYYNCTDGSGSANGGAGGGSNQIVSAQGIAWDLAALNHKQSSINSGNGRIVITLLKKAKKIFFNGIEINQLFYNGTEMDHVYFNGIKL